MGGLVLDPIPVAQQPSLSVEESIVQCAVGSRPTNEEVLMHSGAISSDM